MARTYRYAVCVGNRGDATALEVRKICREIEGVSAESRGLIRVIDESGEDYLYQERFFVPIEVPREATRAFSKRSA